MATIDLRHLDSNRDGSSPVSNGSDISWGEILTAFGTNQSLGRVLRELYDDGLIKFTFSNGAVAQDTSKNPYRDLSSKSYSPTQKAQVVKSINVEGGNGKDTIYGTDLSETIKAGNGDDLVIGGGGADVQSGGRGKDTFTYKTAADSVNEEGRHDLITDFNAREGDRIDLSALGKIGWGGQAALGGGTPSAWYSATGSTASLFVDLDGNGAADMRIDLKGVTSIAQSDLIGVAKPATPPVTPPNPTPPTATANPDASAISEDARLALVSGNVLSNDASGLKVASVNGQKLSTSLKAAAVKGEHGVLAIGQDGKWVYTLNNRDAAVQALGVDETLAETFTYVATGKGNSVATSTLTVTIKGTNDGPVAVKDTAKTDESAAIDIAVLQNDTDKDATDSLSVTSAEVSKGQGTASVNPDGTIKYDPAGAYDSLAPDETAEVVITYKISDGHGGTATSTATVIVTGKANGGVQTVSDPAGLDKVVGTDQVDTVVYTGSGPVGSASSPFILKEGIENFQMEGSGALNIQDNAGNNNFSLGSAEEKNVNLSKGGSDSVTGTADELDGANITGFSTNDRIVVEGAPSLRILDVTAGSAILHLDTDANGSVDATVRLEGDGLDGSKLDPNDFTVSSSDGASAITFTPDNNTAPVAAAVAAEGDEDTIITGKVAATDADTDALTYKVVEQPKPDQGTLDFKPDGTYSFTPAPDYNGEVIFTYKANDGTVDSNVAAVTITVNPVDEAPVNTAPVAEFSSVNGDEDTVIRGKVTAVDEDGDTLSYAVHGDTPEGLTFNADGTYSFVPAKDFNGEVTFQFVAKDGTLESAPQTATINVMSVNDAPVAKDGSVSGVEDAARIEGKVSATDRDGDTLTYELVEGIDLSKGTLNLDPDGTYSFSPVKGFSGEASFTYKATDGTADSNVATVAITVDAVNSAPVAQNASAKGDEDTVISGRVTATDEDGDTLTYNLVDGPDEDQGTLVFKQDGTYSFTPAPDFNGEVTFTYKASDGKADSNVATATITVKPVDEAPALPEINILSGTGEVVEGGVATYTFTRTGNTTSALDIAITVIGSAVSGQDYMAAPDKVTFAAGAATATLDIQTATDNEAEPVETIEVAIAPGADYRIGASDTMPTDLLDAPPARVLPTLSISDASASEGGNANFRLILSEPVPEPLTVTYQIEHGTTSRGDVPVGARTLTIARNITDRGFNVATIEDALPESDETFTVKILSVTNANGETAATIVDGEGTGTILNDDGELLPAGVVITQTGGSTAVTEGSATDTFTVALATQPTADVTVQVATGNQLTALGPNGGSSELVFTSANWNVPQTITVKADDEYETEGPHSDVVTFYTMSTDPDYDGLMPDDLPVAITDGPGEPAPIPYVTVANLGGDATEGGEMSFTFHRSEASGDLPILWERTGGTISPDDIEAIKWNGEAGGYEGFKGTSQTATLTFVLKDDTLVEGSEDFGTLTVKPSDLYLYDDPYTATGTVLDNDEPVAEEPVPPEVSVSGPANGVTEGETLTYTFTRSGSTDAALDVSYSLGGTATAGSDFTSPSGTVTFVAGQDTTTVTVETANDTDDEANETIDVTLKPDASYTINQQSGSASGSIIDNDEPVIVTPTDQTIVATTEASSFVGGEGNDTLLFPIIPTGTTQLLGGSVANASISLGGTIVGTPFAGKTISNIENLSFENIQGPSGRTLTINGDAGDNILTVTRTTRKTDINGGDGNDTISFTGTTGAASEAMNSVISGGAGNDKVTVANGATIDDRVASGASGDDTYDLGTGLFKQELLFGADNGNDTVTKYSVGNATVPSDVLNFAAAGIQASNVMVAENAGDTVFTINQGGTTGTVTVKNVTGLEFGTHWTAEGTPPGTGGDAEEPTGDAGILLSEAGGTEVAEGGKTDTIGIVLTRKPTADVTIQVGADPGLALSQRTLTFTPENWNHVQDLTVTAEDDPDYEGTHAHSVFFSPATSDDPLYDGLAAPYDPLVSVIDNDEQVNTAPTASPVTVDIWEDDLSVDVTGFGSDAETGVTYAIVSQPEQGTVTLNPDGQTFRFEGNPGMIDVARGEVLPVTFAYKVNDGKEDSAPATITINVHGMDAGDETIIATSNSTSSQTDFFPINGGDGIDTVVFNSFALGSGANVITLGGTVQSTPYAGKPIENVENITLKGVTSPNAARTLTVNGDGQANVITVEATTQKLLLNGLDGDDTFNFAGTGAGETSILRGGSGNDTVNAHSGLTIDDRSPGGVSGDDLYDFGTGVQHANFYGSNGNDTVSGFEKGVDKLHFLTGAQGVRAAVVGDDTVFTTNTGKVTVLGVTDLVAGTDWMLT
ncbi:tandem-95 repeat protein [Indioceanicola profundi]|uniref:tandem-95 repeat protein n=1 Tax=Indioceanicola profundi TaxID=2220096 RepID=UPI000E6AB3BB|nr:tandem-95 repeat protein [Indioceanicola profundi]